MSTELRESELLNIVRNLSHEDKRCLIRYIYGTEEGYLVKGFLEFGETTANRFADRVGYINNELVRFPEIGFPEPLLITKMKKSLLLLLCLLAVITVKAQSNEPPSNVIKVSGGLDFITSKMYLPDYTTGTDKVKATSWQPGVSALVDYEHFWKSGWGFGLNFMYNDTRYSIDGYGASVSLALRSAYFGPCLLYSGCFNDHWRVECGWGMGYGRLGGDLADYGGFGMMLKAGIEYMVNRHFGVGVELNELVIYTKEDETMKEFKKYYTSESEVLSGMSCLGLAAGVRFYF